jgi:3-hydroxyisobutyrate dehydrogenase-like beta-hydroxyacid dehydrogenase
MTKPVVGLIGLGAMGGAKARHLLAGGFRVIGYDLNPEAMARFAALGGEPAASHADLAARSDVIIIIIVDDAQVKSVCMDAGGIFANARPGTLTAVMSSVTPDLCVELAAAATRHAQQLVDAPSVRGEAAANAGRLLVMIGGDATAVERCRPVLGCFASDLVHLGPVGSGQVGKMVNNMILWAAVYSNYEGFRFARTMGIDVAALRETLKLSAADSWVLRTWDTIAAQEHWWDQKDLASMLETGQAHGADLDLAAQLKRLMEPLRPQRARRLFSD